MKNDFSAFLQKIAPYVVVCGSFARRDETESSDIDCFLRSRSRQDVDQDNMTDETYMPEVLEIIQQYGYDSSSVIVGHIAVERQPGVPRMVEISSHYAINHMQLVFYREIYGVKMMCAVDNKETRFEERYDSLKWDDKVQDLVIPHPVPAYTLAGK